MGQEKTKQTSNSTQKVEATAEETALNKLQLGQAQAADPGQRLLNENSTNLINQLLTGQQLPGYLQGLPGGISPEVTQGIVDQSLKDIAPQFQANGIFDSGVAASISGRTAADIRNQSAQFNINNLQNLLGLASGQGAGIQNNMGSQTASVGNRLAGLRTISTSGGQSTFAMNPFLKSFQTSAGNALGSWLSRPASMGGSSGGTP